MKNIVKIYLLLLLGTSALFFTSCEDLLDKDPLTDIGNDSYWRTSLDLNNYVLQFYPSFPTIGGVGSYTGMLSWDATRGTDTQITASPNTFMNGASSAVTTAGGIDAVNSSTWSWGKIRSINTFFDNYTKCEDPLNTYAHYLGEAHFFKAWFYFEKVRDYGDVPWYTNALELTSEGVYAGRDSRTQVVDSILWHLDRAFEHLNLLSTVDGGNNRLSKEAALLFKSRVALYEGTWQKYHKGTAFATPGADPDKYFRIAADAAEQLIDGAEYTKGIYSDSDYEGVYNRMFSLVDQSNNKEVILWRKFSNALGSSHQFQTYVSGRTGGISVTLQQIQHYLKRDGQPYDYITTGKTTKGSAFLTKIENDCDPRLSQLVWTPGKAMYGTAIFSKPYLDKSGEDLNNTGFQYRKGNDPTSPQAGVTYNTSCETGSIVFRYAEALLNYAEAKSELSEAVNYAKSLNLLRKRVNMPDFNIKSDPYYADYSDYGYSISNELREIRRERTVELACEGYRYDDIRRWAAHHLLKGKRPKGYPLDKSEWGTTAISYKVDGNGFLDPFATSMSNGYGFKENRDYLRCIPTNEIVLNPNLKQNPGWDE
ncbi:MAG: RagB/SusD family nutrient uptake outer membrane protein [Prevotella sp.]|jgi:hypothetical protein|nr:RagB/SusD family nutrient uptake outer membrane protein [Prevotella sp.]